jgi:DNA-binding IclR family transcriptional regulator
VQKAFTLLKAFNPSDEWVSARELGRRARIPEASSYRLIETLVGIGAVTRGARGYRIGPLFLSLSRKVAVDDCLQASARDIISNLSGLFDVTASLGRLEAGMIVYVARSVTARSFRTPTEPGTRFEPYSSALGKVLLAGLAPEALERFVMDDDLVPLTKYTITDKATFMAELARVRREGYAIDNREFHMDVCCVAVPVCDGSGRIVASMSASEHADFMTFQRQLQLKDALMEAAANLGSRAFRSAPAPVLRSGRRYRQKGEEGKSYRHGGP